jgi:hypothetical protein
MPPAARASGVITKDDVEGGMRRRKRVVLTVLTTLGVIIVALAAMGGAYAWRFNGGSKKP